MYEEPLIVRTLNGNDVEFTGEYKDAVFSKTLKRFVLPPGWETGGITENWDEHNQYNSNNYGYRGPDFRKGVQLLTAGCSVTYGLGIPEGGTWSATLAKLLSMSYVNLSAPAASVEFICNSIYRYIDTFGKPEIIVVLFPDMIRGETLIDTGHRLAANVRENDLVQQHWNLDRTKALVTHQSLEVKSETPKYIKKPYELEYVKTEADSIYTAVKEVRNLESYCAAAGIPLVWSTWANDFVGLTEVLPEEYKFNNFHYLNEHSNWLSQRLAKDGKTIPITDSDPEGIVDYKNRHSELHDRLNCPVDYEEDDGCICFSDCHFNMIAEFPNSFHLGTDRWRVEGKSNAHPGVHKHVHFAEDFRGRIAEVYGI